MNSIRCVFSIAVLFSLSVVYAQNREITLIDSITHESVAYASVLFIGKDFGGKYSSEQGKITIPDSVNAIKISHVSYKPIEIYLQGLTSHTIQLSPSIKELSEVTVNKKDRYKKSEIGFHNYKSKSGYVGATGFMLALYIPYKKEWEVQPYISEIMGMLQKSFISDFAATFLRIDLQKPDKITKAPDGVSLLNESIVIRNKRIKKKNKLMLREPILFPKEGVFIVVEWIKLSDEFQYLNPAIGTTNQSKSRNTWHKRVFAGDTWKILPITPFEGYEDGISNICFGLTVLE
ncbi:MAG: hypothetical protein ACK5KP_08800 [Paludibacteraceae bacterium]